MNDFLDRIGFVSADGPFHEDWRQEDLTTALGQVQCRGVHNGWPACPFCKAVL